MYTHSDFRTSASVRARTAVINVKRASVLDLLSQATYIRSEKFKKQTPPNMARGNQISNAVGTGLKAHSVVGQRPTTTMQNLGVVKKIKVAQKGILN